MKNIGRIFDALLLATAVCIFAYVVHHVFSDLLAHGFGPLIKTTK